MRYIQNRVCQIMKEKGITSYQLKQQNWLDKNTISKIVKNPDHSFTLKTLEILTLMLECSSSELLCDTMENVVFEELDQKRIYFERKQLFIPENTKVLDHLLSEIGIHCNFDAYNYYKALNITNVHSTDSYEIDMNIRGEVYGDTANLAIVDFYFSPNKPLYSQNAIRAAIVAQLEEYAKNAGYREITFYIDNDSTAPARSFSEQKKTAQADFSYPSEALKNLFINQGYQLLLSQHSHFQLPFQKTVLP